eukprot:scaffold87903_cov36-Phaeocystis_antarctica.AAC.1
MCAGSCGRLGEEYRPAPVHEVEAVHRLGSLGYQAGPSEPRVDEHGRATCTKSLMSQHTSDEVTM